MALSSTGGSMVYWGRKTSGWFQPALKRPFVKNFLKKVANTQVSNQQNWNWINQCISWQTVLNFACSWKLTWFIKVLIELLKLLAAVILVSQTESLRFTITSANIQLVVYVGLHHLLLHSPLLSRLVLYPFINFWFECLKYLFLGYILISLFIHFITLYMYM